MRKFLHERGVHVPDGATWPQMERLRKIAVENRRAQRDSRRAQYNNNRSDAKQRQPQQQKPSQQKPSQMKPSEPLSVLPPRLHREALLEYVSPVQQHLQGQLPSQQQQQQNPSQKQQIRNSGRPSSASSSVSSSHSSSTSGNASPLPPRSSSANIFGRHRYINDLRSSSSSSPASSNASSRSASPVPLKFINLASLKPSRDSAHIARPFPVAPLPASLLQAASPQDQHPNVMPHAPQPNDAPMPPLEFQKPTASWGYGVLPRLAKMRDTLKNVFVNRTTQLKQNVGAGIRRLGIGIADYKPITAGTMRDREVEREFGSSPSGATRPQPREGETDAEFIKRMKFERMLQDHPDAGKALVNARTAAKTARLKAEAEDEAIDERHQNATMVKTIGNMLYYVRKLEDATPAGKRGWYATYNCNNRNNIKNYWEHKLCEFITEYGRHFKNPGSINELHRPSPISSDPRAPPPAPSVSSTDSLSNVASRSARPLRSNTV